MKGAGLSVLFHVMVIKFTLWSHFLRKSFIAKFYLIPPSPDVRGLLCRCIISLRWRWRPHGRNLRRPSCCTSEAWRRAAFLVRPRTCTETSFPASSRRSHAEFAPISRATPAAFRAACARGCRSCSASRPRWSTHRSQAGGPEVDNRYTFFFYPI